MSGTVTTSLHSCLLQLNSERVTDRKKQVEALKSMLTKKNVLAVLDKNTDTKRELEGSNRQTNLMTWDTVFNGVKRFIDLETNKLGDQASTQSSKVENVKRTCCSLFKLVIESANSRGPRIKAKSVVNVVLRIMSDSNLKFLLGPEFTSILLKYVIQVRHLFLQLSSPILYKLFEIYTPLFAKSPVRWSKTTLHELLRLLINGSKICVENPKAVVEIFLKIFCNVRHETPNSYHDGWLGALLTFCKKAPISSRAFICDLGENLLMPFLHFWNNRPSDSTKLLLLEFFHIQLILHHPLGKLKKEDGAFTVESEGKWLADLKELCDTLLRDCDQAADRGALSSSKDQLRQELICTLVEVCHVVFSHQYTPSGDDDDIQQSTTISSISPNHIPSSSTNYAKRRRRELQFWLLLEPLKNCKNSHGILPWLQLISALLQKYPDIIDISELVSLVECLHDVDRFTNQSELRPYILRCWCTVVHSYSRKKFTSGNEATLAGKWIEVFDATIRMVALNQYHEESHSLLYHLIRYKLVTPKLDFFKLYLPGSNNGVSQFSLRTLCMYLLKYPVPSKPANQVITSEQSSSYVNAPSTSEISGNNWFRYHIMHWMLLSTSSESTEVQPDFEGRTWTQVLCHLLVYLCVQNGTPSFTQFCSRNISCGVLPELWKWTRDVEKSLLENSFDFSEADCCESITVIHSGKKTKKTLRVLLDFLQSSLLFEAGRLCDNYKAVSSVSISNHVCLLLYVLEASLLQGVITAEELVGSQLGERIKCLMKRLSEKEVKEKLFDLESVKTLNSLTRSEGDIEIPKSISSAVRNYLATLVPDETFQFLFEIVTTESQENQNSQPKSTSLARASTQLIQSTWQTEMHNDLMDIEDITPAAQEELENSPHDTSTVRKGFGVPNFSILRQSAFSFLCKVFFQSENRDQRQKRILQELKCEAQLLRNPPHMSLVLTGLHIVASKEPKFALICVREILNLHEVDVDGSLYVQCLDILKHCVTYVTGCSSPNSEEHDTAKEFFFILEIFWNREQKFENDSKVSYALAQLTAVFLDKSFQERALDDILQENSWTRKLLKDLMMGLRTKDLEMQMTVARSVSLLVVELPEAIHQKFFDVCYSVLLDTNQQEKDDPLTASSLLTCLYHLATIGGSIERKALFIFLQTTKVRGIEKSLILKVFNLLSKHLGFSNRNTMLQFHLPYLLNEWMNHNNLLHEFPFELMNCTTISHFYRENLKVIVTILFDRSDMKGITKVSSDIGRDLTTVVKETLPSIMSHVIAWSAVNESVSTNWLVKKKATNEGHKWLQDHLSPEILDGELKKNFDDLVTHILLLLHNEDQPSVLKQFNIKLPPPEPTAFPAQTIINAFTCLITSKKYSTADTLFTVLTEYDHALVNIMLNLRVHLLEATRIEEESRLILVYQLFAELLLPSLTVARSHSVHVINEFIAITVRQLTRSSINGSRSSVRALYIYLLETIIKGTVDIFHEDIKHSLPMIINCLVAIIEEENPKLQSMICSLLKLILLEKSNFFKDVLRILDPLPAHPCLQELRNHHLMIRSKPNSLNEAFNIFWLSFKITNGKPRLQAFEELLDQIKSNPQELKSLISHFQSSPLYSEDLEQSPFHLVISSLVKMCTTGTHKIQQVCAECLGEIGPVELGTPLLCPVDQLLEHSLDDVPEGMDKCYLFIFKSLVDLIHDDRLEVVRATVTVLKNILMTKCGQNFITFCKSRKIRSLLKHLLPFSTSIKGKKYETTTTTLGEFMTLVDNSTLWVPNGGSYAEWLETLVCTLIDAGCIDSELFPVLKPLCRVEVSFNENLLPFIIHALLLSNSKTKIQEILSSQISNFFSKHCEWIKSFEPDQFTNSSFIQASSERSVAVCRSSLQTMLKVIQYLRGQNRKDFTAPAHESNYWLTVDYLDIAMAAQFCGQHFTVLCYIELWRDENQSHGNSSQSSDSNSQEMFVASTSSSTYRTDMLQKMLLLSYKQVGDKDGLHGCSILFEDTLTLQNILLELHNRWDRILQVLDSESSSELRQQEFSGKILKALQKCGLNHTSQKYLSGILHDSSEHQSISRELLEFQCECSWRLGHWDLVVPEMDSAQGVHQSLFRSLVCLNNQEFTSATEELCVGRQQVLTNMQQVLSKEQASYSMNPYLSDFRLFSLAKSTLDFFLHLPSDQGGVLNELLNKWSFGNDIPFNDFEFIEPSLYLQGVLLFQLVNSFPSAVNAFNSSLEKILTLAREQGHLQVADHTLQKLLSLQTQCGEQNLKWKVEEARNRWSREEITSAQKILKSLLKTLERKQEESPASAILYAETLMQLGKWQAESCCESPATILTDCLEKALNILEPLDNQCKDSLWEGHLCVGRYADLRFQEIKKLQQSQSFALKKQIIEEAIAKAQKLRENSQLTNDEKKAIRTLEKQSQIDVSEIKDLEEEAQKMLIKAVKSYLHCLRGTDKHDLRAFRVVSLWFQYSHDMQVSRIMEEELDSLPTHKFLPLIHQLAARMGTTDSADFQKTLKKVIIRMCKDHPYHSTPVILALSNADRDEAPKTGRKKTKGNEGNGQEVRKQTAVMILNELKSWVPVQDYVQQLEHLCLTYITFAYCEQTSSGPIPKNFGLIRKGMYYKVPVITQDIKVDRSLQYHNLPYITSFEPTFRFVGGVNAPKVITCIGSDGKKRQQLVKGHDDLRQDAVMQQVFVLVNCLLKRDPEALKRKLNIRTYKVIPLSSRSGVLQWCDGTIPLGIYLSGPNYKSGAHRTYNPKEITAYQCREIMASAAEKRKDKLNAYMEICRKFTPVFRYFFLENFPEPAAWYERRLAYTRSVATCSIVGYILGLGDRHVQNILLDKNTAELIHIDFGVAFEQGRISPTPETVPFRLTRDIVDGMGIAKIEGVFRRCCERSLEVMRASQESLLTILEVLLYDPLYLWSISPQEAISHQRRHDRFSDDSSASGSPVSQSYYLPNGAPDNPSGHLEVNKLAERVLLRLREKLQGVEDSVPLSVPGQVSLLIQQAVDPRNLCRLFPGWQPFL